METVIGLPTDRDDERYGSAAKALSRHLHHGAPAPDIGTGARKGNALAITAVTPTSYTWTFFAAGKPFVQGRNSLAFDRMTFTEVSWLVSKPGKLVTLIYDRR